MASSTTSAAAADAAPAKRKSKGGDAAKGGHAKNKKQKSAAAAPPLTKKDYASQRKHADVVVDGKRIWNSLRCKTNSAAETRRLVDELLPLVRGKAAQLCLQHDASRVVQAALQFGSRQERLEILHELCPTLPELSKSQYASFCVLKAIKYASGSSNASKQNDELPALICAALKGHMRSLAVHATASRVVEAVFTTFAPKHTRILKQEFYGPHFSMFAADILKQHANKKQTPNLLNNLALVADSPAKQEATMEFVRQLVTKLQEKQLYGLEYVQELLLEYSLAVVSVSGVAGGGGNNSGNSGGGNGGAEIRSLAATSAEHAIHLLATRAGTHVVCNFVAYGTPKDRKKIVKSLKGYSRSGLLHKDAYLAILRLVQLTDDTVLIQKNIFSELLTKPPSKTQNKAEDAQGDNDSPLLELALSDTASKLFLMLLSDDTQKLLDPYEHGVLFPNPCLLEKNSGSGGEAVSVPTSKKEASVRRKELLKHVKEPLVNACAQHANSLIVSIPGSTVVTQVYGAFRPVSVVEAILDECSNDTQVFEHVVGHRTIKTLILMDAAADKKDDDDSSFAAQFLARFGSRLADVAHSNRGAFVVAALAKVLGKTAVTMNASKLQAKVKAQKKKGKEGGPTAGYEALLKEIA